MCNHWILLVNLACALVLSLPSASAAPAPGREMDQEIDAIVDKITEKPVARPAKQPGAKEMPAGARTRKAGARVSQPAKSAPAEVAPTGAAPSVRLAPHGERGVRGGTEHTASLLTPPLPRTLTMSQAELAALRSSLFGKPRWRVEAEARAADTPAHFALPRGI
jgi:hypothetical protein